MMKQGRLGYNSCNGRYGLLSSDLWIDTGFHCGEGLEVLVDDKWVLMDGTAVESAFALLLTKVTKPPYPAKVS